MNPCRARYRVCSYFHGLILHENRHAVDVREGLQRDHERIIQRTVAESEVAAPSGGTKPRIVKNKPRK